MQTLNLHMRTEELRTFIETLITISANHLALSETLFSVSANHLTIWHRMYV